MKPIILKFSEGGGGASASRYMTLPKINAWSRHCSSIRWESMGILDFSSIAPCLQHWLPIIIETSKMQCRIVIPQVLDENRWILFILSRYLHIFNSLLSCYNCSFFVRGKFYKFTLYGVETRVISLSRQAGVRCRRVKTW